MHNFDYHRAGSLEDAEAALKAAEDGLPLAGGMTLIPTLKQGLAMPSDLVDLGGIADLAGVSAAGDVLSVGAMTTHAAVADSEEAQRMIPALACLAAGIGDPAVRNRGTIGGSLANNDPAADYPAAVLGLDATIVTTRREIAADDFFIDMFETALEDGELIAAVRFPKPKRAGYAKFPNPASRYAVVGVFVAETAAGVRVAVTGAAPCIFRQAEMEAALANDFSSSALEGVAVPEAGLNSDLHADPAYRAHLIAVMARRAVAAATGA